MVDGGLNLGFHTKELNANEKALIMGYHNQPGFLLFKENDISDKEIPIKNAEFDRRTPSQRMRNVIYLIWQNENSTQSFEEYYRDRMEAMIGDLKTELP